MSMCSLGWSWRTAAKGHWVTSSICTQFHDNDSGLLWQLNLNIWTVLIHFYFSFGKPCHS